MYVGRTPVISGIVMPCIGDPFAVRRKLRPHHRAGRSRYDPLFPARKWNHEQVIAKKLDLPVARSIGHKGYPLAVRRHRWHVVVPFAFGDLFESG